MRGLSGVNEGRGDANRSRKRVEQLMEKLCSGKKGQFDGLSERGRWQQSLGEDVHLICVLVTFTATCIR